MIDIQNNPDIKTAAVSTFYIYKKKLMRITFTILNHEDFYKVDTYA